MSFVLGQAAVAGGPPPGAWFSQVPLMFEAGEPAAANRFFCRGPGYAISLRPTEMVVALPQAPIE